MATKKSGVPTEAWEQKQVIKWSQQPSVRMAYPELKFLYHIENERKCTPQQGAERKRMGIKDGVPDLHLPVPAGQYHGLYIEMKAMDGKPDEDQLWWIDHLKENGYACRICYCWQQATEVLVWYLNLKR